MACYTSGATSYVLNCCHLTLLDADGMPICSANLEDIKLSTSSAGNLMFNGLPITEGDAIAMGFADLAAFVTFLNDSIAACCVEQEQDPLPKVGVSHFKMCRVADTCDVVLEACKDEDGVTVYTDIETGGSGDIAWIQANYTPDCAKNCQCTSIMLTFDEGVTVDNAMLLGALGAEVYPDASSGGTQGIRGVRFVQADKKGVIDQGLLVWNGGDPIDYAALSNKTYMSEGFVDIPPFTYEVIKGCVVFEVFVYKCA